VPAKPTLILVPGLVNDAGAWRHQVEALRTRADVRVAEHGARDSIVDFAYDVLAAAPAEFAIAGHSMGGRIAMEAYRLAPDRIRGLGLLDTNYTPLPAGDAAQPEIAKRRAFIELARHSGMRAMVSDWVRDMVHPARLANDAALIDEIVTMMSRSDADAFERQVRALLGRPDAADVLQSVRCPTLVLCGREDAWSPPSAHAAMARLVPGAELEVVPECGHMCMLERPAEVTAALQRWLDRVA
jgi:pimeloyl-ACP methyl ester carboxylesterase